ncbi:hypothetical protein AB6A40_003691 [Gnathostoma spinigerum]|uniref:Peptidase M13 N-terminal domain-containing protein n=1 Tax=Gnathostoma spinigerum TaxID=75299 RepID=A0ABD6EJW1_9BILA
MFPQPLFLNKFATNLLFMACASSVQLLLETGQEAFELNSVNNITIYKDDTTKVQVDGMDLLMLLNSSILSITSPNNVGETANSTVGYSSIYELVDYPELVRSINESLDPCDDFYEYVCYGWMQDHEIATYEVTVSQFTITHSSVLQRFKCKS